MQEGERHHLPHMADIAASRLTPKNEVKNKVTHRIFSIKR